MIGCSKYDKLLNSKGTLRFEDMNEAEDEAMFMVEQFKSLNYEVELRLDPDRKEMDRLFLNVKQIIKETIKAKERILVHFYYTGHGKMKDQAYMVLNEPEPKKALFPLESKMRSMSLFPNTCVYALLDCCREQFNKEDTLQVAKVQLQANSKGEKSDTVVEVNEESNRDAQFFTITFGCPPTLGVQRGSCLGPKYIAHLKGFADRNNGKLVLPMALVDFNDSEEKSETIIKCPW